LPRVHVRAELSHFPSHLADRLQRAGVPLKQVALPRDARISRVDKCHHARHVHAILPRAHRWQRVTSEVTEVCEEAYRAVVATLSRPPWRPDWCPSAMPSSLLARNDLAYSF